MLQITHAIFVEHRSQNPYFAKYPLWILKDKSEDGLNIKVGTIFTLSEGKVIVTNVSVENSMLRLKVTKIIKP